LNTSISSRLRASCNNASYLFNLTRLPSRLGVHLPSSEYRLHSSAGNRNTGTVTSSIVPFVHLPRNHPSRTPGVALLNVNPKVLLRYLPRRTRKRRSQSDKINTSFHHLSARLSTPYAVSPMTLSTLRPFPSVESIRVLSNIPSPLLAPVTSIAVMQYPEFPPAAAYNL